MFALAAPTEFVCVAPALNVNSCELLFDYSVSILNYKKVVTSEQAELKRNTFDDREHIFVLTEYPKPKSTYRI